MEGKERSGSVRKLYAVTALTCARAPLVLIFMLLVSCDMLFPRFIAEHSLRRAVNIAAISLLLLSSVTDLFDGMLARKWRVTSRFGAICDPLMDKVFFVAVFPTVTAMFLVSDDIVQGVLWLLLTVFHILRDMWIVTLRSLAVGKADMKANFVGKLRTFLSFPLAIAAYVHIISEGRIVPALFMYLFEAVVIVLNFYSLYAYTRRYGFAIREAMDLDA